MTEPVKPSRLSPAPAVEGDAPASDAVEADLASSKRLSAMTESLVILSRASNPNEAISAFFADLRRALDRKAFLYVDTADLLEQNFRVRSFIAADGGDMTDAVITEDDRGTSQGGFVGEVCEAQRPRLFADLNLKDDPVFGTHLLMYRSAMVVPVWRGGKIGGWVWVLSFQPESFSEKELAALVLRANLLGITVQKLEHAGRLEATEGAGAADVSLVSSTQQVLNQREVPDLRGLELAREQQSAGRPGGDYYSVYEPDAPASDTAPPAGKHQPRFGFLIADVQGRGPAAAMGFAMMDALFSAMPQAGQNAAAVLGAVNAYLCGRHVPGLAVRAFLGFYNTATRTLDYSSADAPLPIVRRPHFRGEVEILQSEVTTGVLLGERADASFESGSIKLAPDDTILFLSDGVAGARNRDGEMLGSERIETAVRLSSGGPQDVIDRVLRAVREHEANQEQTDDQTLIAMRVHY